MVPAPAPNPMRHTILALTVAVSLLLGTSLRADDFVFSRFGDYLEALRAQAGIPGLAAAVVGTNDILWHRAFGRQDLEQLVATRTDTPFEIDGLTQMLAATIVLRCVEDGSLWLSLKGRDGVKDFINVDFSLLHNKVK